MSATLAAVALTVWTITRLLAPQCKLHPEVPVATLAGLLHLGVAARTRVLGRTRRRDDGRVHDGARAQQQPPFFQKVRHRIEDGMGQPVLLQQVAEAQNRTLVRHHLVAQLNPPKTPHRLAVVDRIFGLWVRQIEPLLQEVNPQHLLQSQRLATLAGFGVVRLDHPDQPQPRNHRIHLAQEPLAPSHFALPIPRHRCERPLIPHPHTSTPAVYTRTETLVQRFPSGYQIASTERRGVCVRPLKLENLGYAAPLYGNLPSASR